MINLQRRFISVSFSRPDIQLMRDLIAFLLRQIFHADAFRNVLPDQAVQIFMALVQ